MRKAIVDYCPRCGGDHGNVSFRRFRGNPISSDGWDFSYWGWCPSYLEPIIFYVDEEHEPIICKECEGEAKEGEDSTLCRCTSECEDSQSSPDEAEPLPTN